jgi:ADP-ribose pyrophosphatase YjhB (NUDIX family)
MARRYIVYIEGKPVTFADTPLDGPSEVGQLIVRIDHVDEVERAVHLALQHAHVRAAYVFDADLERLWNTFRAPYKFVVAAGGVVTDDDGRLLVIRRLGKWDLPKGKVEQGEAIEAAAVREVQEECGLQHLEVVRAMPSTWHTYEQKGRAHLKRTDWFLMNGSSTEGLVAQREEGIEEVRWMTPAEIADMRSETYPSLLPIVEAWEQR